MNLDINRYFNNKGLSRVINPIKKSDITGNGEYILVNNNFIEYGIELNESFDNISCMKQEIELKGCKLLV